MAKKIKRKKINEAIDKGLRACDLASAFGHNCVLNESAWENSPHGDKCPECRKMSYRIISDGRKPKPFDWLGFTRGEFVVNCRTKEDAEEFCRAMHDHGLIWRAGNSYLRDTYFETHLGSTCYSGTGGFATAKHYKDVGIRIIKFKHGKFDLR